MGVFDFLKSKNKETASIDAIFEKAANDPAYRPLFYRTLLESELYLLTFDKTESERQFVADKDTKLQVRIFKDDVVPIFTSKERIFDNNIIKGQVNYAASKANVIFKMFSDKTKFIINPYSRVNKELLPEEVRQLLANELYETDEVLQIKAGETILLSVPANYPVNLVETLKRYFDTRKEIKGAYLALMYNKSNGESPHLLLGMDIPKENMKDVFGEIGAIAKPYLKDKEPFDMVGVTDSSPTSKNLKVKEYRIY